MKAMPGKSKLSLTNADRRVLKPWVEWTLQRPVQSTYKMFVSVLTGNKFTTDFELRQEVEAVLATGKWKIAFSSKGAKKWAMAVLREVKGKKEEPRVTEALVKAGFRFGPLKELAGELEEHRRKSIANMGPSMPKGKVTDEDLEELAKKMARDGSIGD